MTRDDILNMPAGREMDALIITKVMNWQLSMTDKEKYFCKPHENMQDIWLIPYGDKNEFGNWSPSTDISAAFEALHKWLDNNKTYAVQIETVNIVSGRLHDVVLWGMDDQETYDARAEDLALAISRVLLLAVMEAQ